MRLLACQIGEPDAATIVVEAGVLKVGTITATQIGTDAVDTAEIAAGAVETAELGDGAVTTAKLDDTGGSEAVTGDVIRALAVGTGHLALNAVTETQINASAVTPSKMEMDGIGDPDGSGTFSHYIVAAGFLDIAVAETEQEFEVAGVLRTDIGVGVVATHASEDNNGIFPQWFRVDTTRDGWLIWQGQDVSVTMTFAYTIYRACVT